ncbi:MAG: hypothetical protein QOJ73_7640 [Streptosporangiaceae bacterium]|jgi:hypothetical protein|nr:hypothetical protein [Streptosporangiaceae bacterium]
MEPSGLHRPEQAASGTARTLDRGGAAAGAGGAPTTGSGDPGPAGRFRIGALARHPVAVHLAVLVGFIAAGIAVTWPRATYLAGRLPATRDAGSYVWGFWWIARQAEHLSNPWFTSYIAAPTGTQLGLHALMPLPGLLMIPITLAFGPSASYNLLSIAMPGLFCYATYRVGRLWLPSQVGAIAAGAFFGLSSMLTWRSWYHLNLAAGVLFIPLALEAAVRLRRRPGWRQALVLGLVVGGAVLTDQEMAVLVIIVTGAALLPWLLGRPAVAKLWPAALAALVAVVFASPQIIAVMQQTKSGGATSPLRALATSYVVSGVQLPDMFAVSPRADFLGLNGFPLAYHGALGDGIPTFGLVLTVLALLGLVLAWRRRGAWLLALLWLGCAALALGAVLKIGTHTFTPVAETFDGQRVSAVMPYTWFVRLPVLAGFREASRIMMLGILPAALLAGAAVDWLRYHAAKAIVVVAVLGLLEAGWAGSSWISVMPTALPAADRQIAADHSNSMVVDVPYGIRGGTNFSGRGFDPDAQVLATADGHPRAVGFISRVPAPTVAGLSKHPFFARLVATQEGLRSTPAELAAARLDARRMGVGWVLIWNWQTPGHAVLRYLRAVGFHFDYRAEGVRVWRPNVSSKSA